MWEPIKELLMSLMTSALGGFDEVLADASDVLQGNDIATIWAAAVNLSQELRPFCYTIIALCMMIEIASVASKVDIIKFEHGLKLAVKMCLAKVFIDTAPTLLLAIYRQAQSWISDISTTPNLLGTQCLEKLEPLVDSLSGLGGILGIFLSTFIVLLAIKICGLMVMVMAYGRIFEVLVYVVVSPVPCAFFPLGNGDGGGFSRTTAKFLRSFAAVCLQGVMMMVVLQLFSVVIGAALGGVIDDISPDEVNSAITNLIYTMLLGSVSLVMAITKCGSWAKSILDAM